MSTALRTILMGAASATAFGATLAPAQAQDDSRRGVETILVEAQRREQSQQDVPLSIGAYSEDQIDVAGVRDIRDLIQIAPGLMVTSTQNETITTARIRGIGTVGDNYGLESSVAVLIDGVYRPRNGVGFGDLGEIERIEVLRGPQGTLFGRNTSAGVINIVTAQPNLEEWERAAQFSIGNYDYRRYELSASGPLGGPEAGLGVYFARGERDGYTDLVVIDPNSTNGEVQESENQDFWTVRGQFVYAPGGDFELRILGDYSTRDEVCCSAPAWDYDPSIAGLVNSALFGGGAVTRQISPADPDNRVAYANRPYFQEIEDHGVSAEWDWDLPFGTLTSVTGWRSFETNRSQDVDYSGLDIANRDLDRNGVDFDTFSQEFRLAGVNGRVDWLVGAYYADEDLEVTDAIEFGSDWEAFLSVSLASALGAPLSTSFIADTYTASFGFPVTAGTLYPANSGVSQDIYNQDTTSWALFTHNTISITDRLDATIGLRYSSEEKDVTASFETASTPGCSILEGIFGFDPATGAAGTALAAAVPNLCLPYARSGLDFYGYDQSLSDDDVSGTFRLSYALSDDILAFAGYSRGFKAGGFNLDRQFNGTVTAFGVEGVDTSFAPETTDAYEVGFNSELFSNALRLNATAFYQRTEDFQLNTFNGLAFVVDTVPQIDSHGAEVDFLWAPPVDGLDISGGVAYVDAQYDDFSVAGNTALNSLAGQNISLSPEWFVNGAVTYRRPMFGNLVGLFHVDGRWVSEYNTGSDLDPEKVQESFGLLNARVGLGREDGAWQVELWGRNLTDETYAQVAFDAFAQGRRAGSGTNLDARGSASYDAFLGAPMTWGVTLRSEF